MIFPIRTQFVIDYELVMFKPKHAIVIYGFQMFITNPMDYSRFKNKKSSVINENKGFRFEVLFGLMTR
ncbi:hypothetical protein COJ85_28395 [Bacillus sp. AFS076308]|nr:hypothetical protein COJ85_28395 [Bacillus sp. AFS076308]PGV54757.1 hypothetical protein COD92_03315 [Bacillus sp. AFS037270]